MSLKKMLSVRDVLDLSPITEHSSKYSIVQWGTQRPEARCDSNSKELIKSPKSINLPIASTPKGHIKCVVFRKPHNERKRLVVVPNAGITQAFLETGIFINDDSRCCKTHLEDGYLSKEALSLLTTTKNEEQLLRSDICKLLSDLRDTIKSSTYLNFDVPSLLS